MAPTVHLYAYTAEIERSHGIFLPNLHALSACFFQRNHIGGRRYFTDIVFAYGSGVDDRGLFYVEKFMDLRYNTFTQTYFDACFEIG